MIKTAVIGYGLSAKVFHLPFIHSLSTFALVALCTRQHEAAVLYPHLKVYADANELLAHTDAELVVICSPNSSHFALAERALTLGKHVIVEKPLCINYADAIALEALALQQNRLLAVYHNRRFDDDFLALKQLLLDNRLGAPRLLLSRYDRFRPQIKARWKEDASPGNGVLYDLGTHLLDQAIALFGAPTALTAKISQLRSTPADFTAGADYFQLDLHYAATPGRPSLEVQLGSSPFQALAQTRFELHAEGGSFRVLGTDPQEQLLQNGLLSFDPKSQRLHHARHGVLCKDGAQQQLSLPDSDYAEFYRQVAHAITEQQLTPPIPLSEALLGIKLLALAEQSSRQGRTLYVD